MPTAASIARIGEHRTVPRVSDDFTRTASTTSLGTAPTGQVWTVLTAGSVWGIDASGRAYAVSGFSHSIAVVETGATDQTVTAFYAAVGGDNGLVCRVVDDNNYYVCTATQLYKRVAGTFTAIGSSYSSLGSQSVVTLSAIGSAITVTKNGVTVASATDTTHTTGTKAGLRAFSTSSTYDNFSVR